MARPKRTNSAEPIRYTRSHVIHLWWNLFRVVDLDAGTEWACPIERFSGSSTT